MTLYPVCWPVLDQEMKRFLSFRKSSKTDYIHATSRKLEPGIPQPRFWQKCSCQQMQALEEKTQSDLEAALEKERRYNRLLSVELEKLSIESETELIERHLWAVIEENRSLLKDRERLRRNIEKECRDVKAKLEELTNRGKDEQEEDGKLEEYWEDKAGSVNQISHAHSPLLDKFYGSEEGARENLQRLEKSVLEKIDSATSDKDLKRVKSTIIAKQGVLLYALSLVEVMRTSQAYPGSQTEEDGEDAQGKKFPKERKRKERYLIEPRAVIPTNLRRTANKRESSLFTWNSRISERWDNSTNTEVELFQPNFEILETNV